jgi:hypothetical protein
MGRYDTLRASDADRDAVTERLREAAGEGRLAPDELEERVDSALRARTYGELARLVADLPRRPNSPWRPAGGGGRAVARPVMLGAALLAAAVVALAIVAVVAVLLLAAAAWWLARVAYWLLCCGSRRKLAPGSHWRRATAPGAHRPRPTALL